MTLLESGVSSSAVGVPLWKTLFFFFFSLKISTVKGVNRVTDVNLFSSMQVLQVKILLSFCPFFTSHL